MKDDDIVHGADFIEFDPNEEALDRASYSVGTKILIWVATHILTSFFLVYLLGVGSGYLVSVLANSLVS